MELIEDSVKARRGDTEGGATGVLALNKRTIVPNSILSDETKRIE